MANGWIAYTLEREASINEVVMKLTGWRMRSYPISIYVDRELVYSGNTQRSLGYITIPVKEVRGREITVKLTGAGSESDAFGQIVEVENQELDLFRVPNAENTRGELRIVEIEFYERPNSRAL